MYSLNAVSPRTIRAAIWALTVLVFALVFLVIGREPMAGTMASEPSLLATVNASLNGMATCCLIVGLWFVRRRRLEAHQRAMLAAFAFSCLFLVGYVLHHATVGSVRYQGTGAWRTIYFSLLIPHIVLAAPVVPMALFTLSRALTQRIPAHRRLARVTLPIWLFVSASGVVIYWMLYWQV